MAHLAKLLDRLPHAGSMRLIDHVRELSPERIRVVATSHLDPANPLRGPDGLAAVHALEYAAQATALHGAAGEGVLEAAPLRLLATVREASFGRDRLDDLTGPLEIEARLLAPIPGGAAFDVTVSCGQLPVMTARLLLADARPRAR